MYESSIAFTLDMICPWTYLAKARLGQALAQVRATNPSTNFTMTFEPHQLHTFFPESADRQKWLLDNEYNGDANKQQVTQAYMKTLGEPLGIAFNFSGEMGNTLHSHRVIQLVQDAHGPAVTNKLVDALFRRFFQEAQHPSSDETLRQACVEAGVDEAEAKELVEDHSKGERKVKEHIMRTGMNGDAVPDVLIEGKRRDFTLTGAKEVADYVKALETVVKESS
ncbi:hypothetical protein G7046_g9643 [Stylonectria norvegica]|nr:hypothetical protein G7046_g9643 [Stylonectria norvegica]